MPFGFSELHQHQHRVLNLIWGSVWAVIQKTQTHNKTSPETIQEYIELS